MSLGLFAYLIDALLGEFLTMESKISNHGMKPSVARCDDFVDLTEINLWIMRDISCRIWFGFLAS